MNKRSFETFCVKESKDTVTTKPHNLPIYSTSSFEFNNIEQGIDIFDGTVKGHLYARYGNPTVEAVANKIAALEGYDIDIDPFGIMTSSGMSAVTTVVMGMMKSGDAILTQGNLYGGTTQLIKDVFTKFGITSIFVNLGDREAIKNAIDTYPEIKTIYFESPSNPGLDCVDMEALVALAKPRGIYTIIDNTFCSPMLQQPFQYGIDFIIHSTTKYLNGHGNSISGIIVGRDKKHYSAIWDAMKYIGTNLSPWEAWLVNNGLKTLPLRMKKHCENAMALATMLAEHPHVAHVNYLGLKDHHNHALAKKQMNGFGGMLSFEVNGGIKPGMEMMNRITIGTLAPTLGDIDTLILHPASMSHRSVPRALRMANGISDGMIRVSVGIEGTQDLVDDFSRALNQK
ncbi:MAG: aminotransferase class I/II-fold pyridoxal phosphate-dependent enzyme [Saprospiraceae bacterium]